MTYVKTYGIQTSGTGYTDHMVETNFVDTQATGNVLGWKRGVVPEQVDWTGGNWTGRKPRPAKAEEMFSKVTPELKEAVANNDIRYIIISKHPYALYSGSAGKHASIKYKSVPVIGWKIADFAKRYNRLYSNWLAARDIWKYSCIICHEDWLRDFGQQLRRIQERFRLIPVPEFRNIEKRVAPSTKLTNHPFDAQEWFLNQTYMKFFSREDIRTFNELLDPEIVEALGYELPNPKDY